MLAGEGELTEAGEGGSESADGEVGADEGGGSAGTEERTEEEGGHFCDN